MTLPASFSCRSVAPARLPLVLGAALLLAAGGVSAQFKVIGADGKLCGDVDFASASAVAGAITPVPGGVGPMTIAMLLSNTVDAAERSAADKGLSN